MNRILLVNFLFTFALGVLADSPKLQTCKSTIGHVEKAIVTGSQFKNGKYILKHGTEVGIEVTFNTEKKVNDLKASAEITLNGMNLPTKLPNLNGCKVLKCPLNKGGPYVYKINMPVSKFYPKIETTSKLRLKNEKNKVIACVIVPIKVV
ncbi:NPC intracellular cholesterol transporter 2 homolog a-like [Leptopilina boulardi]|uniref:NPC intracellular cholesterol transporter 2 homolog a-like n=1 Tax=Leptopilina boulardi TaxID=63433 RepID=UPI0021F669E4|nr:NPC intracellular cholesterol transporter 2 homolog a-like [Leptopilina boulardi]